MTALLKLSSHRTRIELAFVVMASLAVSIYAASRPLNHDVSWYLVATRRWLDGAELYEQIIEINPPLAFYEVAATLLLPGPDKWAHVLGIGALSALSAWWSRRLLLSSGARTEWLLGASLLALLAVPLADFAQREHLLLIFVLPYVWAYALRVTLARGEEIAIGGFAFLGLALKPYFLIIPALMTLVAMVEDRSFRPAFSRANLTIGCCCIAYLLFIWARHPNYLEYIVPMAKLTYFAYGISGEGVLARSPLVLGMPLCLAAIIARGPAIRLAAALFGAMLAYLVQFKGWGYHLVPVRGFTCLLAVWLLVEAGSAQALRALTRAVSILALSVSIAPVAAGTYSVERWFHPLRPILRGADSALLIGENVWLAYPLVQEMGVDHVSRYPALWPLPGATIMAADPRNPHRAEAEAILEDTRRRLVDDFIERPPDVLIVDARRYKPYFRGSFDYLAFLGQDSRFKSAMAQYRQERPIGPLQIFRRRDISDRPSVSD